MCEPASAFSKAFVNWSPDVDRLRLSTRERDHAEMLQARVHGVKPPSESEEAEASELLQVVDNAISERFGIDPVVARYMLCSRALVSGEGIVPLARALVRRLNSDDASRTIEV